MVDYILLPEIQQLIQEHLYDDPTALRLKWAKNEKIRGSVIVDQIISRRKAEAKFPALLQEGIVFPPPLSIEQSSSELTARFKSQLVPGSTMIDLTGGAGIDTYYFSQCFRDVGYVEKNESLFEISSHNFKVWGVSIRTTCIEAETYLAGCKEVDLLYLDPSRRKEGSRVFKFEDAEPNVISLLPNMLHKAKLVLVKASPLIDIANTIQTLKHVHKVWIVAVRNEVKEVLFLLSGTQQENPTCVATDLVDDVSFEFSWQEETASESVLGDPDVGQFLFDPNRALLKSGVYKLIGQRLGLKKVGTNTHLYLSDEIRKLPGRLFRITGKADRKQLNGLQADVISKNHALSASEIVSKYKLRPGDGDQFVIAYGRGKLARMFVCEKVRFGEAQF